MFEFCLLLIFLSNVFRISEIFISRRNIKMNVTLFIRKIDRFGKIWQNSKSQKKIDCWIFLRNSFFLYIFLMFSIFGLRNNSPLTNFGSALGMYFGQPGWWRSIDWFEILFKRVSLLFVEKWFLLKFFSELINDFSKRKIIKIEYPRDE